MKRFIIGSLSFLLVSTATALSASAETATSAVPNQPTRAAVSVTANYTPFQLVHFAYRGSLSQQGIPGYGSLLSQTNFGRVNAKSLVKAGITKGLVSPDALSNLGYLNAVESQLEILNKG